MTITSEKELGIALKENREYIEIEGSLASKCVKIKATGRVAWMIAIGAIAIAVVAIISAPATGGTSGAVGFVAAPTAVGILGAGTTTSAIAIAVAAGGVGALNKLRKYKLEKKDDNRVILHRK